MSLYWYLAIVLDEECKQCKPSLIKGKCGDAPQQRHTHTHKHAHSHIEYKLVVLIFSQLFPLGNKRYGQQSTGLDQNKCIRKENYRFSSSVVQSFISFQKPTGRLAFFFQFRKILLSRPPLESFHLVFLFFSPSLPCFL